MRHLIITRHPIMLHSMAAVARVSDTGAEPASTVRLSPPVRTTNRGSHGGRKGMVVSPGNSGPYSRAAKAGG